MGGNALKTVTTRRYEREEYEALCTEVQDKICNYGYWNFVIPAYKNKPSFGDMDILVDSQVDAHALITEAFSDHGAREIVANGNVYSFDYKEFQIDLIKTSLEDVGTSLRYFAFNDLGNLLGRVAHKMGFKLGHKGLSVIVKDGDYVIDEFIISKTFNDILRFMGYDPEGYGHFNDLIDIFKFTSSTPFFNKDIYLLDNRNNKSRVRDAKRPSYTAFLKWLEEQDDLPAYQWPSVEERGGRRLTEEMLDRAEEFFPGTKTKVNQLFERAALVKRSHAKWNGEVAMELSGLNGKELGQYMMNVKQEICRLYPDRHFHNTIDALELEQILDIAKGVLNVN